MISQAPLDLEVNELKNRRIYKWIKIGNYVLKSMKSS